MSYQNICVVCQKPFEARVLHKITCSEVCRKNHQKEWHLKEYYKDKEPFNGKCLECGQEIIGKAKSARFCSDKCKRKQQNKYQHPLIDKTCEYCQKSFQTRKKETRFCGSSCSNAAVKKHPDVKKICEECNDEFIVPYIKRNRIFCSRTCNTNHQNKIMFAEGNNETRKKISSSLLEGFKNGDIKPSFEGKHHSQETKDKLSEIKIKQGNWKGENNPAFGGQSKEVREKMSITRSRLIQEGKIHARIVGELQSIKGGFIKYRSNWEKDYIEKLDLDDNIISFIYEPFVIPYFYIDCQRNYIPDLLIVYKDGTKKLIEIKPSVFLETKKNIQKFQAAQEYCKDKNIIFEVWTEKSNPYLFNGIV